MATLEIRRWTKPSGLIRSLPRILSASAASFHNAFKENKATQKLDENGGHRNATLNGPQANPQAETNPPRREIPHFFCCPIAFPPQSVSQEINAAASP